MRVCAELQDLGERLGLRDPRTERCWRRECGKTDRLALCSISRVLFLKCKCCHATSQLEIAQRLHQIPRTPHLSPLQHPVTLPSAATPFSQLPALQIPTLCRVETSRSFTQELSCAESSAARPSPTGGLPPLSSFKVQRGKEMGKKDIKMLTAAPSGWRAADKPTFLLDPSLWFPEFLQ